MTTATIAIWFTAVVFAWKFRRIVVPTVILLGIAGRLFSQSPVTRS